MAGDDGGDGRTLTMAATPAIFRGCELDNGVQLLVAITMVLLKMPPSSWRGGEVRMETKISGDTPARNYRRFGDL
jgi:hypothetical protein